ncbi:MAG: hypothetical protein EFT35_03320 [Methanophagales archaeon ANME-1-THS]|nr:MAG: hypothetical protein EFT35_03320 [Methanophagales archaeon ANME-1-THS]
MASAWFLSKEYKNAIFVDIGSTTTDVIVTRFRVKERQKNRMSAMQRLARVLCSDLDEIGEEGAAGIAEQIKEAQVGELVDSMKRIKAKTGLKKVVSALTKNFILKEAADLLNMDFLSLSSL